MAGPVSLSVCQSVSLSSVNHEFYHHYYRNILQSSAVLSLLSAVLSAVLSSLHRLQILGTETGNRPIVGYHGLSWVSINTYFSSLGNLLLECVLPGGGAAIHGYPVVHLEGACADDTLFPSPFPDFQIFPYIPHTGTYRHCFPTELSN